MPDCSVSIGCWKKRGADRQGCRRLTGLAGEAPVLREDEKRRRTVAVGCQASLFLTAVFPEKGKTPYTGIRQRQPGKGCLHLL